VQHEEHPYVSTGRLPPEADVRSLVDEAHSRYRDVDEGTVSGVYPALARVSPDLFGICVAAVDGRVHAVGDAEVPFTIMSVAKPFTFAVVCDALGPDEIQRRVGVNATGRPFNSLEAVEHAEDGRTNPMVNPGAIATASFAPGRTAAEKWEAIHDGLSRFAGRRLDLDEDVFASASATNVRNRELAAELGRRSGLGCEPAEAVDVYTRQSCLAVTARDLALMGATLADGGVQPLTRERVVTEDTCRYALTVMTTAGLYETSGDWLYDVGLPGKSGIGGGIVMVSPGKGGLGTFAPPLDAAGNSVRGQLVARFLSRRLGLDLFASSAAPEEAA
jgi:glutaminase